MAKIDPRKIRQININNVRPWRTTIPPEGKWRQHLVCTDAGIVVIEVESLATTFYAAVGLHRYSYDFDFYEATRRQAIRLAREFAAEVLKLAKQSKYDGRWNNNSSNQEYWRIEGSKLYWVGPYGEARAICPPLDDAKQRIDSGEWFRCDENGKRIEGAK